MKLDLNTFLPKLNLLKKVLNSKPLMEAMSNFNLYTKDGLLYINASDGENTVSINIIPTEYSEMNLCVNALDFYNGLVNLKNGEIELQLNQDKKLMRCSYNGGFFQFPFTDDKETCDILKIKKQDSLLEKEISDTVEFSTAMTKAQIAIDEKHPIFRGIYFDLKQDGLVVVSCCKSMLSKYKTNTTFDDNLNGFIMSKKAINMLISLINNDDSTIMMKVGERQVQFSSSGFVFSSVLLEGKYPNYEMLIPIDNLFSIIINKDYLIHAVQHVSLMKDLTSRLLVLNIDKDNIIIEAEDKMFYKKAKEKIECKYDGDAMIVGINSDIIMNFLQAIDTDEIEIRLTSPTRPLVFIPKNMADKHFMLCMPMMFR